MSGEPGLGGAGLRDGPGRAGPGRAGPIRSRETIGRAELDRPSSKGGRGRLPGWDRILQGQVTPDVTPNRVRNLPATARASSESWRDGRSSRLSARTVSTCAGGLVQGPRAAADLPPYGPGKTAAARPVWRTPLAPLHYAGRGDGPEMRPPPPVKCHTNSKAAGPKPLRALARTQDMPVGCQCARATGRLGGGAA
jgi:hypothetical protein